MKSSMQQSVMCTITAILLAATYFVAGFAVCAGVPSVTESLAQRTSSVETSVFDRAELVDMALATRDYTVGAHDRDALLTEVRAINEQAHTPYADSTFDELLYQVPDEYTLNQTALNHLDDVYDLVSRLFMPILGIAVLAGFCLMATYKMFGSAPIGRALVLSGAAILILFAVMGIWGIFGFSGFFAGIHTIFFESGTWLFPYDSLLISMYPQNFWVGMGAVWLTTSCVLAVISLISGILLRRKLIKSAGQTDTGEPTDAKTAEASVK